MLRSMLQFRDGKHDVELMFVQSTHVHIALAYESRFETTHLPYLVELVFQHVDLAFAVVCAISR